MYRKRFLFLFRERREFNFPTIGGNQSHQYPFLSSRLSSAQKESEKREGQNSLRGEAFSLLKKSFFSLFFSPLRCLKRKVIRDTILQLYIHCAESEQNGNAIPRISPSNSNRTPSTDRKFAETPPAARPPYERSCRFQPGAYVSSP